MLEMNSGRKKTRGNEGRAFDGSPEPDREDLTVISIRVC